MTPEPHAIANDADARLSARLDEALAPAAAPAGLIDRIYLETVTALPGGTRPRWMHAGVLARLGSAGLTLAATLALAAGVSLWLASPQPPESAAGRIASAGAAGLDALDGLDAADHAAHGGLDQQIALLEMQIDLVDAGRAWPGPREAYDHAFMLDTIDGMVGDAAMIY